MLPRLARSRQAFPHLGGSAAAPKVVEPEMPEWYKTSESINKERYLSTFRGCGSMARAQALREANWYDIRFFIFGNERDLTTRLMNLGYRVKMFPTVEVFHKAPFGMRHGKRSKPTVAAALLVAAPKHGELLGTDLDEKTVFQYLDRFLMYYILTAERLERTVPLRRLILGGRHS